MREGGTFPSFLFFHCLKQPREKRIHPASFPTIRSPGLCNHFPQRRSGNPKASAFYIQTEEDATKNTEGNKPAWAEGRTDLISSVWDLGCIKCFFFHDICVTSWGRNMLKFQPCSTEKPKCFLLWECLGNKSMRTMVSLIGAVDIRGYYTVCLKKKGIETPLKWPFLTPESPRQPLLHGLLPINANYFQGLTHDSE